MIEGRFAPLFLLPKLMLTASFLIQYLSTFFANCAMLKTLTTGGEIYGKRNKEMQVLSI